MTDIKKQLRANGLGVSVHAKDNIVELSLLGTAKPLIAREILYKALNGLEPFFTVFIRGMPFCFMPDARDHILYRRRAGFHILPGGAGRSYGAIRQCKACALRTLCPGIETGSVFYRELRRTLRPVLAVPNEIVFELTRRCNLACRVCFAGRTGGGQPLSRLMTALREARRLGVKDVRFTGGEPTLSRNLLPMLKAARALGFYTLVNTNACGADSVLLDKAAPLIDNVLVSLQGYDAASESRAAGVKGLFSRKLANMRRLRAGIRAFRLGTVASKSLLRNFKAYHALAVSLKADVWEIYRPMPAHGGTGRPIFGKETMTAGSEFDLKAADMKRLSAAIAALEPGGPPSPGLCRAGPRVLLANPMPLCLMPAAERRNLLGAAFDDGHTRLVHDPRGFFKPSYYIEERLGDGIEQAWNSDYMRALRSFSWLAPRCRACDWLLKCLGGSRFQAAAGGGNYFGNDPWLPKERA